MQREVVDYLDSKIDFLNGIQKKDPGAGLVKNLLSDYPSYNHIFGQLDVSLIEQKTKDRILRLYRDHYLKVLLAH